jgi:hypothetical protein
MIPPSAQYRHLAQLIVTKRITQCNENKVILTERRRGRRVKKEFISLRSLRPCVSALNLLFLEFAFVEHEGFIANGGKIGIMSCDDKSQLTAAVQIAKKLKY